MASKSVTFAEAEAKRQKAVDFLSRIGNADAADDFANMTTEQYIAHKGLRVVNNPRRNCSMPETKSDLQDTLDQIQDILESVYTPESSREDLAAAVGDALDQLTGDEDEDEDVDDDDDSNGNGNGNGD